MGYAGSDMSEEEVSFVKSQVLRGRTMGSGHAVADRGRWELSRKQKAADNQPGMGREGRREGPRWKMESQS